MEAKQETIEQVQINKLNQEVRKLRNIVDSLCMTNFLVDYQDGDEEVREWAKRNINHQSRRISVRYAAAKEHNDLWNKCRELTDRMHHIEQDFPHLKDSTEGWTS
jgi:hemerythrin-like domain-containing protein